MLNTPTHLRTVSLTDKSKKELHPLKFPNKDAVGLTFKHPSANFLAVLTAAHYEVRLLVLELLS